MKRSTVGETSVSIATLLLVFVALYVAWTSVVGRMLVELGNVPMFALVGLWCLLPFVTFLAGILLHRRAGANMFVLCLSAMVLAAASVLGYGAAPARDGAPRVLRLLTMSDASVGTVGPFLVASGQLALTVAGFALAMFVGWWERQSFVPDNNELQRTKPAQATELRR